MISLSSTSGRVPTTSELDMQAMWARLLAVVEEQAQVLIRTAFSPIVRECGDISAGIFDLTGRMMAQAVTGTPGHVNTMAAAVRHMLDAFPLDQMRAGDVYATNDPWLASGHLNDMLLVTPVYRDARPVALVSCTSHLCDVGGIGMSPDSTDVFEEGVLIPPRRLVAQGEINGDIVSIIKANSRSATANEGDLFALIAACEVGSRRLVEMMAETRIQTLDQLADYIIASSRRGAIEALATVPRGVYRNTMRIDGYNEAIDLVATLTVESDQVDVDFAGCSPCVRKAINCPLNYAAAYASFAIRAALAPDVPNNAGSLAAVQVHAPEGTVLSAPRPYPVSMRHTLGHFAADLVLGALDQALGDRIPAESASCMWDLPMRNALLPAPGHNVTVYAMEPTHHGGTGARPDKDGLSATGFPSGVWGSQVEITETTGPVRILRRELRTDSGGAGQYRGGLGQVIEVSSADGAPVLFFAAVDRTRYPARGRAGGHEGALGRVSLASGRPFSPKGAQEIAGDDRLVLETPGGGGYGPPTDRNPQAVLADLRMGFISQQSAEDVYGVRGE